MLTSRDRLTVLRVFGFLIAVLLPIGCAVCDAQARSRIASSFSNWAPFVYEDEKETG
jgi:hypothetical protein